MHTNHGTHQFVNNFRREFLHDCTNCRSKHGVDVIFGQLRTYFRAESCPGAGCFGLVLARQRSPGDRELSTQSFFKVESCSLFAACIGVQWADLYIVSALISTLPVTSVTKYAKGSLIELSNLIINSTASSLVFLDCLLWMNFNHYIQIKLTWTVNTYYPSLQNKPWPRGWYQKTGRIPKKIENKTRLMDARILKLTRTCTENNSSENNSSLIR